MRCLIALVAALLVASPALADDKPKPNTLTPKEIADGWLLLFDGETTFGWGARGEEVNRAQMAVKDGVFVLSGEGEAVLITKFQHFELSGEYRTANRGVSLLVEGVGDVLVPGKKDEWKTLVARLTPRETLVNAQGVERRAGGPPGPNILRTVNFVLPDGVNSRVELRNLKLRPLGTKPLFNGKDLTGWKVFQDPKRMATKFEVTKAGELHATNGPGDLQTTTQYADFVLQLECRTNGKGLNSGVFFRCVPDQYQQGYEAQIQNAYLGNDRTKPVDYGTGAIYRRVPARKVVSNDNEWFTMTVVARGPHISTWVNGYQTVDWTDDRKPSDNPRQGLKTGKGHISIQGHDPTTDLLFRNIRIAELPAGK